MPYAPLESDRWPYEIQAAQQDRTSLSQVPCGAELSGPAGVRQQRLLNAALHLQRRRILLRSPTSGELCQERRPALTDMAREKFHRPATG
jgi:hypothetical protein